MKIYLASSWRNLYQQTIVQMARDAGHEVYDFRNPKSGNTGFSWKQLGYEPPRWPGEKIGKGVTPESFREYREVLKHPIAEEGFRLDFDAMKWADTCLMVLPCGRSAHLELGWCAGAGKKTAILYPYNVAFSEMPGHEIWSGTYCESCKGGCKLRTKLFQDFEPELMVKVADDFLIGKEELERWLNNEAA